MHFKPTRVFEVPAQAPGGKKPPPRKHPTRETAKATQPAVAPVPRPPAPPRAEVAPAEPAAAQPPPAPKPPAPPLIPVSTGALLVIDHTRALDLKKLGPSLEVTFKLDGEETTGAVASGQFPLAGRGLAVLLDAALAMKLETWLPETAEQLPGKKIIADVTHTTGTRPVAIIRNIRPVAK